MASQDQKQLSDIIGLIYESAQNPDLWPELLFHIDGLLGIYGHEHTCTKHASSRETTGNSKRNAGRQLA